VKSDFLRPLGNTIKPLAWTLAKDKTEPAAALLFTADNRAAAIMPMGIEAETDRAETPEPEAQPEPETAPETNTVYWLETCGGRPRLTAGTPEKRKRIERFDTKTKISHEVYEKAKSAFSLDWLGSFEEAAIERWQQEFDAQTEAMLEPAPVEPKKPEHTTVKPEKAVADKPMKIPAPVKRTPYLKTV
jgi:hypothetical protein